jgi:hypothetical protein
MCQKRGLFLLVFLVMIVLVTAGSSQFVTAANGLVFDEIEPNNAWNSANVLNHPLSVNATAIKGVIDCNQNDAYDWYKIYCVYNSPVTIFLCAPNNSGSEYMVNALIYTQYNQTNPISNMIYSYSPYVFTPTYTGYFYLCVSSASNYSNYILTLTSATVNESEANGGNNSLLTANGPFYANGTINGVIATNNDVDWFKFYVLNSQVTFKALASYKDIALYYENNPTPFKIISASNAPLYTFTISYYTGNIYAKVTGLPGTYTLDVRTEAADTEPNDSLSPSNLAGGPSISGVINGSADCYRVACIQNIPLKFFLTGGSNAQYLAACLYNQYGPYITAISYNQWYNFTPSYTGYLYLNIGGYAGHNYSVNVVPSY